MFIDTIEGMSDSKYSLMKNISGKCSGEKMHPKMKTNKTLMCGCGTGKEFSYDANIFDCRSFGLFLRKAENSHNKYKGLLQKLNIMESAIFENKETGNATEIETKLLNIFDQHDDINIPDETRKFIIEYMNDKSKNRDDFNRYQVMSTLQSTINFIEYVNNPRLADVIQAVTLWVAESKKIIEGRTTTSSDVSNLIAKQEDVRVVQKEPAVKKSEDIQTGLIEKQKAEKPYPDNEDGKEDFNRHLNNVKQVMNIASVFSKISPEYFEPLLKFLDERKKVFETIRDENIYRSVFRKLIYDDGSKRRPVIDILRKLHETLSSKNTESMSDEFKTIKDSLNSIFSYYNSNRSDFSKYETNKNRFPFISKLYAYLIMSDLVKQNSDYKRLFEDTRVGKTNHFLTKKIVAKNLERILRSQPDEYREKASNGGLENEKKVTPLLEAMFKEVSEQGAFNDNSTLLTALIEGDNGKEKYFRFDPPETSPSSSSSSF